jgi:Flp pilus assembly CpaE family ATPase
MLIAFMRRNYQSLCFDVSGNLERYSLELMQESKRILLVCTPEIPSLHQAREKMIFLKTHDLDGRVSVILNRVSKKGMITTKQVAEIVGAPVVRCFPNDYMGVAQALTNGTLVAPGSELGKAYIDFAESLLVSEGAPAPKAPPNKRKFLDFLTVASQAGLSQDN